MQKQVNKSPKNSKDLSLQEIPSNPQGSAEALIAQAISKGVPVATMERLLAMRKELRAEHSKDEFDKSMAGFQFDCPVIQKTKEVKTDSGKTAYKFAPIDSIITQVKPFLQKHGFSYKSNMEIIDNTIGTQIKVILVVTHSAGHSESTVMTVPLGNKTNIMSQSQVVAAAQTFAKRYAFCNAFGILTSDEDNEEALRGKEISGPKLPEDEAIRIREVGNSEDLIALCGQIRIKYPDCYKNIVTLYTQRKEELSKPK